MKKLVFIIMPVSIIISIISGHVISGYFPLKDVDVFTFVMSTLAIIVALFTFLGATAAIIQAVSISNTWNDIDKRTKEIVQRHQEEATTTLNEDKNARQKEIVKAGEQMVDVINTTRDKATKQIKKNNIILYMLLAWIIFFVAYNFHQIDQLRNMNKKGK